MNANEAIWAKSITRMVEDTYVQELSRELNAIAYLGITPRKELLKISRCQRSIQSNTKLRQETKSAKSTYVARQDSLYF
jgi:hypothetical protein